MTQPKASSLSPLVAPIAKRGPLLPELSDWEGLVSHRTDDLDGVGLVSPGTDVTTSWAGPFRGIASDNQEYFIKTLQSCPFGQGSSLAVELVVGRLGQIINAPVCISRLVRIPASLDNWEIRPGVILKEGWAHGSLAVERAQLVRPDLAARGRDNNRYRHVGAFALYDWCYGDDRQWLHDLSADRQLYSHDHGLYFPNQGQKAWTREMLIYSVDSPRLLPDTTEGLSPEACNDYADALESVSRDQLVDILNGVPRSWPVSNEDLEALGWFLEYRAPQTASRIRNLHAGRS